MLKPDARLVPAKLGIRGLAVMLPDDLQLARTVPPNVPRWRSWYGMDFGPLAAAATRLPYAFPIAPHTAQGWPVLSEPIAPAEFDLKSLPPGPFSTTTAATATRPGRLDAVLVYFDLASSPTTRLSTHPQDAGPDSSWRSLVWLCPGAGELEAGDPLDLTYARDATGPEVQVRRRPAELADRR